MSLLSRSEIIKQNNSQFSEGWVSLPNIDLVDQVSNSLDSGLALNAMPTPFARAEVVREAFEAIGNNFYAAGKTYQNIVSDTLDVLEMLYNYDLYKDHIRIYKRSISSLNLPSSSKKINDLQVNVQYLKDALMKYRACDQNNQPIDDIYVITYIDSNCEYALAMSCPDTLFFTSSRMDRTVKVDGTNSYKNEYDIKIHRVGNPGQYLFDKPIGLTNRDMGFQDYLYHLYASNRTTFGCTAIGKFIADAFGPHRVDGFNDGTIMPISDSSNNAIRIALRNGYLALHQNNIPRADAIFTNEVVSVGYSINGDRFVTISGHDSCLLPLNLDSFSRLTNKSFVDNISYTGQMINAANYTLPASKYTGPLTPFDLGIYPFFKYPDGCIKDKIATYHIILSYEVNGIPQDDNNVTLQFYKQNGEKLLMCSRDEYKNPQKGINQCVVREIRTKLVDGNKTSYTVHYTVIGSDFDFIQVGVNTANGIKSGVLKPKFDILTQNDDNDKIKFAVDFGTTSTYIAVREGQNNPTPLATNEQSMVYLHHGEISGTNQSKVYKYELYGGQHIGDYVSFIPALVKLIKNEFVPSSIDGDVYRFPIRTAVSYKNEGAIEDIFEDANIAFTYDKEAKVGKNLYRTNIKWAVRDNAHSKVYIREIVRMCIIHAISKSYKIDNIEFLYFYPLAMDKDTQDAIREVWDGVCAEFGIQKDYIKVMTESLAPYFATSKEDAQCVASIDIGGGSVDVVVYNDGIPKFATSSLFGCDVLWGNGRDDVANSKANPIFKRLANTIALRLQGELKTINDVMTDANSAYSSSDIINFWLSNDDVSRVSSELRLSDYHPVYVAHFYAIAYHLAQTMKHKKLNAPVEMSLSGNGSLYLGYLKHEHLSTIATTAFEDVYGENIIPIKVTLPSNNGYKGKEMAAFGGLKSSEIIPQIEPYIYLGGDHSLDISQVSNVLDENGVLREQVANSVAENAYQLEANIVKLLDKLQLSMSKITSGEGVHRTTLINAAKDIRYISKRSVVSTLFFAPVQQFIFNIESKLEFRN